VAEAAACGPGAVTDALAPQAHGPIGVRAGHQPEDRQGARPRDPAKAAAAGRPGDRVSGPLARPSTRCGAEVAIHILLPMAESVDSRCLAEQAPAHHAEVLEAWMLLPMDSERAQLVPVIGEAK